MTGMIKLLAGENGVPLIKILAVFFPVLLFLFKYILPWLSETAHRVPSGRKTQLVVELIQFPTDLLFVAIGYVIPQIIDVIFDLSHLDVAKEQDLTNYHNLISALGRNCVYTFILLLLVPFFVFLSKIALEILFGDKKPQAFFLTLALYILAGAAIWLSVFS